MDVRIPLWAPRAARRRLRSPEGVRRCEEASSDPPLQRLVYIRTGQPAVLSWSEYRARRRSRMNRLNSQTSMSRNPCDRGPSHRVRLSSEGVKGINTLFPGICEQVNKSLAGKLNRTPKPVSEVVGTP